MMGMRDWLVGVLGHGALTTVPIRCIEINKENNKEQEKELVVMWCQKTKEITRNKNKKYSSYVVPRKQRKYLETKKRTI